MIFRNYQNGDFPSLMELWQELGLGGEERGDSPQIIDDTINLGGKLILIQEKKTGIIVGSSWMTFDGRRIMLHHFGIKKTHQNQGLGTQLAHESLRFIKDKGAQVKLEVHKNNEIAKHLYEKCGFFAFTDYDIYMIRKTNDINLK